MSILFDLARLVADAGFGVFETDRDYRPSERGIVINYLPDKPDNAIMLRTVNSDRQKPGTPTTTATSRVDKVQVLVRSDADTTRNDAIGFAQSLCDHLFWLPDKQLGDVHATLINANPASFADLGPDEAGRPEQSFRVEVTYRASV